MGIKRLKPTSPARRYQTYLTRDELTPNAVPEKSLLEPKKRISGRNSDGRITIRRTAPDRSVGQIIKEMQRGQIKRGDRVSTKLS